MKYLILVIISLFCLSSLSDHKKTTSISEEEKNRHEELHKKKPRSSWIEEEEKEHEKIHQKIDERKIAVRKHFNRYMEYEFRLFLAEKGDIDAQAVLSSTFKINHFNIDLIRKNLSPYQNPHRFTPQALIPDCTKKRLEKAECPKPPYLAIYWAKRRLFEGHCVYYAASALRNLMNFFVFPKTDIRGHESLFFILDYMANYFVFKAVNFEHLNLLNQLKIKIEKAKKGSFEEKELKKQLKKADYRGRINSRKQSIEEMRNNLSEKDQIRADKWIDSLNKKWSKKYTKDQIYNFKCSHVFGYKNYDQNDNDLFFSKDLFLKEEFLEEHYPYLLD